MDDAGSMLVCRTGRLRALSVCLMILVAQPAIAGTLSGRISGTDDTPLAAKVEVGGTSLSALADADADGRYRIDQGQGEFVHVRGLNAQLNSVTVNGKRIPSPTASLGAGEGGFDGKLLATLDIQVSTLPSRSFATPCRILAS